MARVEGEMDAAFPRLSWGPIIAGVLLALAAHVVLGLVGGALGFAAEPAESTALGALAAFWGLLTPLVATLLGAWLACRLAAREDEVGSNLHGVMVWCVGLVAGALFLAWTGAGGAMAAGSAVSGNAGTVQRLLGAGADATGPRAGVLSDEAARRAAAAAGAAAMAGLCGLIGAFAGAAVARSRRQGKGRGLGWRIAIQRTQRREAGPRAEDGRFEAPARHAERPYQTPEDEVRDVSRAEGPGAPPDPYRQH
jgi:hypothetical protein